MLRGRRHQARREGEGEGRGPREERKTPGTTWAHDGGTLKNPDTKSGAPTPRLLSRGEKEGRGEAPPSPYQANRALFLGTHSMGSTVADGATKRARLSAEFDTGDASKSAGDKIMSVCGLRVAQTVRSTTSASSKALERYADKADDTGRGVMYA